MGLIPAPLLDTQGERCLRLQQNLPSTYQQLIYPFLKKSYNHWGNYIFYTVTVSPSRCSTDPAL